MLGAVRTPRRQTWLAICQARCTRIPGARRSQGQAEQLSRGNGNSRMEGEGERRTVIDQTQRLTGNLLGREKAWQGTILRSQMARELCVGKNETKLRIEGQFLAKIQDRAIRVFHFREAPKRTSIRKADRIERSKGGSRHAAESHSKPNKTTICRRFGQEERGRRKEGRRERGQGEGKDKG